MDADKSVTATLIRRSGKVLKRTHTRLRQTCNFSKKVLLGPGITPDRHGKVWARAAFDGNPAVGPFTGTPIPLHYGPKR